MLSRIVNIVEAVAVVAVLVFVVMLFANEPDGQGAAGGAGAAIYADKCAVCHGAGGEGGRGPRLSDGAVVEAFPDVDDEIVVVTRGRAGGMPSFASRLSAREIRQVVEYTRGL
jgi:cytochrome c oxidase cbb3-type subunit 3